MVRKRRFPVLVAITVSALAVALSIGSPANAQTGSKCLAGKLGAIGKKERRLLKCDAQAALHGVAIDTAPGGCVDNVETEFSTAFGRTSGCTGDETTIESDVHSNCVDKVASLDDMGKVIDNLCPVVSATTTTSAPSTTTSTTQTPTTTTSTSTTTTTRPPTTTTTQPSTTTTSTTTTTRPPTTTTTTTTTPPTTTTTTTTTTTPPPTTPTTTTTPPTPTPPPTTATPTAPPATTTADTPTHSHP